MKQKEKRLQKIIRFGLRPDESVKLHELYKQSACRNLSEYIRKVVMEKPVIMNFRDQAAEETLIAMNDMKNELRNAIKSLSPGDESSRKALHDKIEEIRLRLIVIYNQWSPK